MVSIYRHIVHVTCLLLHGAINRATVQKGTASTYATSTVALLNT